MRGLYQWAVIYYLYVCHWIITFLFGVEGLERYMIWWGYKTTHKGKIGHLVHLFMSKDIGDEVGTWHFKVRV